MRLNSTLTFIFLFVSAALSGPLREKDQSWVPNLVKKSTNGASDDINYNPLLAGAYWEETNGTFNFATATFKVPVSSGQDGSYGMMVGIDGITCESWFTAGISCNVIDGRTNQCDVWSEWSDNKLYYSELIAPGDVLRAALNVADGARSGVAILENLTNGQTVLQPYNAPQPLCGRIAMWGVGINQANASIPFDTVTIEDAMAYGPSSPRTYKAAGARKMEFSQENKVVRASVDTEESSIIIKRLQ
ncbi:peptidase A4 family-domain-containing protein [Boletus edulis BED1]|uniref:Peptidase A4 family-domain-containing protein n=1 Tax=Boletus edulis BED1 TaxID=1328754 RepID=A0AAD4BTY9_BOLED|nr:peptidase A4 family-domain-containing protein [Boletus edulis BED1]